jgi:hypothetical protein
VTIRIAFDGIAPYRVDSSIRTNTGARGQSGWERQFTFEHGYDAAADLDVRGAAVLKRQANADDAWTAHLVALETGDLDWL